MTNFSLRMFPYVFRSQRLKPKLSIRKRWVMNSSLLISILSKLKTNRTLRILMRRIRNSLKKRHRLPRLPLNFNKEDLSLKTERRKVKKWSLNSTRELRDLRRREKISRPLVMTLMLFNARRRYFKPLLP